MPRAPLALLAVVLLGTFALLMLEPPPGPQAAGASAAQGSELGPIGGSPLALQRSPDPAARTGDAERDLDDPPGRHGSATDPDPGGEVQVRIEVRDPDGNLLAPADGVIHLQRLEIDDPDGEVSFLGTRGGRPLEFEVEQGRFSVPRLGRVFGKRRRPAEYDVGLFVFGERFAGADPAFDPFATGSEAEGYVLRLALPAPTRLHVLSKATGADLTGVEVQRIERWGGSLHPLEGHRLEPIVAEANSPIRIPYRRPKRRSISEDRFEAFLVRAAGHAWQAVSFPLPLPAQAVVELSPAGCLEIVLDGPVERLRPNLLLRGQDHEPRLFEARGLDRDVLRLEGLPAGPLRATLSLPTERGPALRLAAREGITPSAGPTRVVLSFAAPVPRPRVRVAGTLRVPAGWPRPHGALELTALDPAPDAGLDPHEADLEFAEYPEHGAWVAAFEFEDVQPGPHAVEFWEAGWRATLDVAPGGELGLELDVPPPCRVRLEFVDAQGRAAELDDPPRLYPTPQDPRYSPQGPALDAEPAANGWTALCPAGPATVATYLSGGLVTARLEVRRDGDVHRVTLRPDVQLLLIFELRGERARRPRDLRVTILDERGAPLDLHPVWGEWGSTFTLPHDERCEVRLERPAGFRAIEPFVVDTAVPGRHEHTIELVSLR